MKHHPGSANDKYEQLLARYDWHASRPPRGYQPGIGRGAVPVVTTAELTVGAAFTQSGGGPSHHAVSEEDRLLDALESMEEKPKRRAPQQTQQQQQQQENRKKKTQVLSLDDVASVAVASTAKAPTLTVRAAREEAAQEAEDYIFADERRITATDVTRARQAATEKSLASILTMGSAAEQSTWVTHARAYREMGLLRKAQETLLEGSRCTGTKGPAIWYEWLSFIGDNQEHTAARRKVLEEATKMCPGEEQLWLDLLPLLPLHEYIACLQRAIIACPAGEQLWDRLLQQLEDRPVEQKQILMKALQRTPSLTSLWGRLARLEGPVTGRRLFQAAAKKYPSLELVIEAAKFVESDLQASAGQNTGEEEAEAAALHIGLKEVKRTVATAATTYLDPTSEASRNHWLRVAIQTACGGNYSRREEQEQQEAAHHCLQDGGWTASLMLAAFVVPGFIHLSEEEDASAALSSWVQSTSWVADLKALLLPLVGVPTLPHLLEAAVLGTWWVLQSRVSVSASTASTEVLSQTDLVVRTAPDAVASDASGLLLQHMKLSAAGVEPGFNAFSSLCGGCFTVVKKEEPVEEKRRSSRLFTVSLFLSMWRPQSLGWLDPRMVLLMAKGFFHRRRFDAALHLLQFSYSPVVGHPPDYCLEKSDGRIIWSSLFLSAIAKTVLATGDARCAEQVLRHGTRVCASEELPWVKLAVHLRSLGNWSESVAVLEDGLRSCPGSRRLWLMRMELAVMAEEAEEERREQRRATLRELYRRALAPNSPCRLDISLWIFAALRVEAEALQDPAIARAMLCQAASLCLPPSLRALRGEAAAVAVGKQIQLGVARVEVERLHSTPATALEAAQECLQSLPKTATGALLQPAGTGSSSNTEAETYAHLDRLLSLYIDLTPPSSRGRAASQVLVHWQFSQPLVMLSVARLYHQAAESAASAETPLRAKAYRQVMKAMAQSAGRCGDAVALLWALSDMPAYRAAAKEVMAAQHFERRAVDVAAEEAAERLPEDEVRRLVRHVTAACQGVSETVAPLSPAPELKTEEEAAAAAGNNRSNFLLAGGMRMPNSGPLWIQVSKRDDPANVTLLGFRDSLEAMLGRTKQRLGLSLPFTMDEEQQQQQ